ncbi:MAG: adenosylhomocysteinase [Solirubrobacteraceae bacterium]
MIDDRVREQLEDRFTVEPLSRERFLDPLRAVRFLKGRAGDRTLVLADIGGYFAPALSEIAAALPLAGVVEDTENGLQRYEALELPCPVFSVARSPLKNAEDYLVGSAIVFSTEALLRQHGHVLQGRTACVLGFGKIGRSVAARLEALSVTTTIFDVDPVRSTEAASNGYRIARSAPSAVRESSLVVCATGRRALSEAEFAALSPGAFVVSVTSSDDELDMQALQAYSRSWAGEHLVRYEMGDRYFFVLNEGNAVNFLHGAVLGPAIFLVQAEVLTAIAKLTEGVQGNQLLEIDHEARKRIARTWLEHFIWTSPIESSG